MPVAVAAACWVEELTIDINWIVESPFGALPVGEPSATAVSIDGVDALTYEQLRARRNRFVTVLRDRGVTQGDRVGMVLLNSLDCLPLYFAVARIGAIAVRVNFRLASSELEYILRDSGCRVVVFHSSRTAQLEPIRDAVGAASWLCLPDGPDAVPTWAERPDVAAASSAEPDIPRPGASDPVMIMYTSGTTGRPKGAVWTHENTLWTASMQALRWSCDATTVAMSVGPFYHVMGFEAFIAPALIAHGSVVLLSSGGLTTERVVTAIHRAAVTNAWMPPFVLYDLLRDEELDLKRLGSLRLIMCGGDHVQPWAMRAVEEKLPGVAVQQGYGLTEGGSMVTILEPGDTAAHPDSVGRPFPLTEVQTMLPSGEQARPDEVGEVWVRSPAISGVYWNRPEESRQTFVDGWCRTGDLGRITPDGFLVITGRDKDMIRSGGENIYPAEVEAVLAEHPAVALVAVVAVPDAKYLEVGCAVIRARDTGASPDELEVSLRTYARDRLAGYKCPRHYVFVDELPINTTGKIEKRALRGAPDVSVGGVGG